MADISNQNHQLVDEIEQHLFRIELMCGQLRHVLEQHRKGPLPTPVVLHDGSVGVDARRDEPPSRDVP
jgi:hypothetical protein